MPPFHQRKDWQKCGRRSEQRAWEKKEEDEKEGDRRRKKEGSIDKKRKKRSAVQQPFEDCMSDETSRTLQTENLAHRNRH